MERFEDIKGESVQARRDRLYEIVRKNQEARQIEISKRSDMNPNEEDNVEQEKNSPTVFEWVTSKRELFILVSSGMGFGLLVGSIWSNNFWSISGVFLLVASVVFMITALKKGSTVESKRE